MNLLESRFGNEDKPKFIEKIKIDDIFYLFFNKDIKFLDHGFIVNKKAYPTLYKHRKSTSEKETMKETIKDIKNILKILRFFLEGPAFIDNFINEDNRESYLKTKLLETKNIDFLKTEELYRNYKSNRVELNRISAVLGCVKLLNNITNDENFPKYQEIRNEILKIQKKIPLELGTDLNKVSEKYNLLSFKQKTPIMNEITSIAKEVFILLRKNFSLI